MKLLVTGGAGYIGSTVTTLLVEAGHEVTVLDDLSSGHESAVPDGTTFVKGRVQDAADDVLGAGDFDAVLHFAGFIEVAESVTQPDRYWENNVGGTLRLLDAMHRHGVGRLIFSSTGTVHGNTDQHPITETAGLAPLNPYAATKAAVDLMLPGYCAAWGLAATSLRYFNAAGALLRPDGRSCGEQHDPESHLIPIVLQVAAGERDTLALYGDDYDTPDGTCVRDYIHVADLASAHLLALAALQPGEHRIYNLGNGAGYSNLEVIQAVRDVTGHPVPVVRSARRPGDIVAQVASSAKAIAELGWQPQRPALRDIIGDAWAFGQDRSR
ncbi:UDP-glucose 4-epimerase GalE [Actinocatenispora sera]|uniref:UDP-glucose 4-epimerase n=1 Tax=Actinocatenispora sera TaxID=390989 RepID=A0A810L2D7_9ACTN|nr:UDP-glucose 4-epimerase GalE [Actinocatenispora sera]BCJ28338.1 UDP-glucose 4-epimerase GalE [Actinocatenispora sera]